MDKIKGVKFIKRKHHWKNVTLTTFNNIIYWEDGLRSPITKESGDEESATVDKLAKRK